MEVEYVSLGNCLIAPNIGVVLYDGYTDMITIL
jgi:hypothetical protein